MDWCAIWDFIVEYGGKALNVLGGLSGVFLLIVGSAQLCGKKWLDWWFEKKNKDYQEKIDERGREHKKQLDEQLAEYNSALDEKSKTVQSRLDTQLEVVRIEYSKLYVKRVEVIHSFYDWIAYFCQIYSAIELMRKYKAKTIYDTPHTFADYQLKRILDTDNQLYKFNDFFIANKLFLPKSTADKIDTIVAVLFSSAFAPESKDRLIEGYENANGEADELRKEQIKEYHEKLNAIYQMVNEKGLNLNDLLLEIESEFRHLMGSEIKCK